MDISGFLRRLCGRHDSTEIRREEPTLPDTSLPSHLEFIGTGERIIVAWPQEANADVPAYTSVRREKRRPAQEYSRLTEVTSYQLGVLAVNEPSKN